MLNRHSILPAGGRSSSIGWRHLMSHYKDQILACDFFIDLGSRQVHFAGITDHPNNIWLTQQARQLVWELDGRETPAFPDPRQ